MAGTERRSSQPGPRSGSDHRLSQRAGRDYLEAHGRPRSEGSFPRLRKRSKAISWFSESLSGSPERKAWPEVRLLLRRFVGSVRVGIEDLLDAIVVFVD